MTRVILFYMHKQLWRIILFGCICALTTGGCNTNDSGSNSGAGTARSSSSNLPKLDSGAAEFGWVMSDPARSNVKREKIGDYRGKVLVLDFYATWCEPCRDSVPELVRLQQRYESQGVNIVGLNVGGPDDRVAVPEFAREFHIQYPLGFPDRDLADLAFADNAGIPQTFVFDRNGRLVNRFVGYGQGSTEELERAIQEAMVSRQ
jgi:thiol-disulfide isomerase/thioredoxin